MYEEYFQLSGQPFKLNPDPKFFFGSRSHNKAMAYLHYGLRQAEGFIVITGEIGAGKSMLISHLLDQLDRSRIAAAHLLTPNLKPEDLLSHILSAFRIEPAGDGKTAALEAFEDFLFDQLNRGRRVLLIVDEAQNLPAETLEELRVLSNMDYDGTPLFQVFLVGQPDFRDVLSGSGMEQLRQRIIASYHLEPLSADETKDYVEHRLAVVGWRDNPEFAAGVHTAIFRATVGVPRKINKLCNRILLHCSLEERRVIDAAIVESVDADLSAENVAAPPLARVEAEPSPDAIVEKKPAETVPPPVDASAEEETAVSASDLQVLDERTEDARDTSDDAVIDDDEDNAITRMEGDNDAAATVSNETEARDAVILPFDAAKKITRDIAASTDEPARDSLAQDAEDKAPSEDETETAAEDRASNEEGSPMTDEKKPGGASSSGGADSDAPMSVLDRLRAQRSGASTPKKSSTGKSIVSAAPKAPPKPAEPATPQPAETAPEAPVSGKVEDEAPAKVDPASATMHDVADAIAKASAASPLSLVSNRDAETASADEDAFDEASFDEPALEEEFDPPAVDVDAKGWRQSIVKNINETRDELKSAHATMTWLKRQIRETDKKRRDRNSRVVASLSRAETLLTEFKDAWR
ncbi:MAG: XrtA/PEP-CTERM system-associated ATPase [Pseudomonadota bacterium]